MKAFLLSLLISIFAFAADEDPTQFCQQFAGCTETMHRITNEFSKGDAGFSQRTLIGYSGACYHVNSIYDANHEHHGAFVFERTSNSEFLANGIFSFFAAEDPYQHMTSPELKEWFIQDHSTPKPNLHPK